MNSAELLKKNNIKPSLLRVKILDFLSGTKSHPTVDEIYSKLLPEIPTLSRTTVYNTVKLLSEAGLSKVLTIEGAQTRYDADISLHGHFLCDICGKVYDFDLSSINYDELDGFEIKNKEVYYYGTCKKCLNK